MNKKIDCFGIGDIIINIILNVSEDELKSLNMSKGVKNIIKLEQRNELINNINKMKKKVVVGGYGLNTMKALSYLGLKTSLTSKIGLDSSGVDIQAVLSNSMVDLDFKVGYGCTDTKVIFKTPDNKTTKNHHHGVSRNITYQEVDSVKLKESRNLLITGDLFDYPNRIRLAKFLTRIAKESETKIIFDLKNVNNIMKAKNAFKNFVDSADVVIASLDEAYFLYGTNQPEVLMHKMTQNGQIAVLKMKDNYIVQNKKQVFNVSRLENTSRFFDEFFAAGFIFGYNQEYSVDKAAIIASYLASKNEIDENILDELHKIF